MRSFLVFLFILFSFPHQLFAQKIDNLASFRNIESESYFRFNYDNDYFAATDRNYTQGYSLELVAPGLRRNPVNNLFFRNKSGKNRYGIAVEHIGFTPANKKAPKFSEETGPLPLLLYSKVLE